MEENLIRAVARALAVLRLMNTAQRWTLHELHGQTRLPKSTLFRVLATLQHEGYVQVDPARGQYTLSAKVHELSAGYSEQSKVVNAGAQITLRVTREIKWPLAIGVRDGEAMVVAHSTMPYSPLAVHSTTIGHRLSLTGSAIGQAYLAHCSDAERNSLLDLFELSVEASNRAKLLEEIRGTLSQVRHDGYAVRRPGRGSESATVAVPIQHEGEAIAALGMTVFGRLMSRRMVEQFLPVLMATAQEIALAFSESAQ
jgi:IclR family transcriptional regulator, mhp operon transcriptional activator